MLAWRIVLLAPMTCASSPFLADAQSSSCPLDFTATPTGDGNVTFHWSGFGGADGYQVFGFAGQGNTAGYSPMLSGDARDATASNIASGTYTFWVNAYHSGTIVATSCQVTTSIGGGLSLACPTNVTASAGVDAVGVHWDAVANATGYRIAREVGSGPWDDNYGATTTTSFVDTNVTAGGTYSYRVITQNTREPPAACAPVTAHVPEAKVPFFPTPTSMILGLGGSALLVTIALTRRR